VTPAALLHFGVQTAVCISRAASYVQALSFGKLAAYHSNNGESVDKRSLLDCHRSVLEQASVPPGSSCVCGQLHALVALLVEAQQQRQQMLYAAGWVW
jgi:hypothetical protein